MSKSEINNKIIIEYETEKICLLLNETKKIYLTNEGKLPKDSKKDFLEMIFEINKETIIEITDVKHNDDIKFKLGKIKEWLTSFIEGIKLQNNTIE